MCPCTAITVRRAALLFLLAFAPFSLLLFSLIVHLLAVFHADARQSAHAMLIVLAGAPDISGGMTWEYAGGYNLGRDFDSGFGMF
jgi:hypothetical protein